MMPTIARKSVLVLNALSVAQRKDIPIYVFGIDGRMVHNVATVSYAERSKDGVLSGYQRGSVTRHIREILNYLSSNSPLLPNAIVVALDERASFKRLAGVQTSEWGTFGRLTIPLPKNAAERKVGWIVDGQQRATALAKLAPGKSFPVVVVGFQSSSQDLQREQFVLVNKTKPLPRDLMHEILPAIHGQLPRSLERRRVASEVLQLLRFDAESPFFGRVRGLGADGEGANISQAAVVLVIQGSIQRKGVLYDYPDASSKSYDCRGMARVVSTFYDGVRRVWPSAWSGNPKTSRLVHGVGIVAMGHLMDRVMREIDVTGQKAATEVEHRLRKLAWRCAWTTGRWPSLRCAWNELQNTSQDKARLTDYLLKEYARLNPKR